MNRDRLYVRHVLECIDRIEEYTGAGRDEFLADPKTQDAVLRNLQVLAESTQRLSDGLKALQPQVDWRALAGLRNVLVHDYLGVRIERAWQIVVDYLPSLKAAVAAMREALPPAD